MLLSLTWYIESINFRHATFLYRVYAFVLVKFEIVTKIIMEITPLLGR